MSSGTLREAVSHAAAGAVIGTVILGTGGRILMRVVAHWEGRVPSFTAEGTFTVVLMGALAGLATGIMLAVLIRFVRGFVLRTGLFLLVCLGLTARGVNELLLRPKLLFFCLTALHVAVLVTWAWGRQRHHAGSSLTTASA